MGHKGSTALFRIAPAGGFVFVQTCIVNSRPHQHQHAKHGKQEETVSRLEQHGITRKRSFRLLFSSRAVKMRQEPFVWSRSVCCVRGFSVPCFEIFMCKRMLQKCACTYVSPHSVGVFILVFSRTGIWCKQDRDESLLIHMPSPLG